MTGLLIENIIAVTHVHQRIPFDSLVGSFPDVTYNKKEQPVYIIRFSDPKRAVFILTDGQFFCTGATSLDVAELTLTLVIDTIKKTGIAIQNIAPITIHTITASFDVGQLLHLPRVKDALPGEKISYHPQKSLWLEYHPLEHLSILFFPSGKLILTGHTTLDEMKTALCSVRETLVSTGILKKSEGNHA